MKDTKCKGHFKPPKKLMETSVLKKSNLITITRTDLQNFSQFLERRADSGIKKYFLQLMNMPLRARQLRNLNIVLRLAFRQELSDALTDGITSIEKRMLFQIEKLGSLNNLAVAHYLLDINLRQDFIKFLLRLDDKATLNDYKSHKSKYGK